ncbi:MAG: hypothetical protein ACLTDR_06805 [Adlercreutzia equolifaciens]
MEFGSGVSAGCSSGTSDEDAIRASLASELDSIKDIDDAFVNEFSESIDMSQLSVYGIDGVEFMKSYLSGFDYAIDSINVDGDKAHGPDHLLPARAIPATCRRCRTAVGRKVTADPDALAALSSDEIKPEDRRDRHRLPATASSWRPPSPSPSPTPRSTEPGSRPRPPRATSRPR